MTNNIQQLHFSALGFYKLGIDMASKIKNIKGDDAWKIAPVATVNLSFSTELFLKYLNYTTTEAKILKTHKLLQLFKILPHKVSKKITQKYNELKVIDSENLPIIRLSNNTDIDNPEDQKTKYDMKNLTIEQLLEIHNESFPEWRYAYATEEKYYVIDYNFKLMNDFILSMIYVIDNAND